MEKKGTKIAYFIALAIVVIALVIAKVTNDGSGFVATGWALFPPVVAIALALISKEVYSSLFLGCLAGALLLANFQPWQMVVNFVGAGEGVGMINAIDISILIFLVMLGIMVDLMNKAGGSAAFGRWASRAVTSRRGAWLAAVFICQTAKTEREVQTSRSYCVLSENKWFVLDCSISKRIDPQFTTEKIR